MIKKNGFTLIELLVVVAIIGILMSILIPSIEKSRGVAKLAVCQSNLKQLGYAYLLYSDENSQSTTPKPNTMQKAWFEFIYPYHGSERIIHCPSVDNTNSGWGSNLLGWSWGDFHGSYGLNGYTYNDLGWAKSSIYKKITEPEKPSNTPLLMDMSWVDTWMNANSGNPTTVDGRSGNLSRAYIYRHVSNKIGVSMIDGSAKAVPVYNLLMLDWMKDMTYRTLPKL
ncbi:MAG: type II secretion system GspH family protein [Lentisphaeraceae bacterium]|nr:type II secretion system GspH family protein [Lentisphaeraceae bacterium]